MKITVFTIAYNGYGRFIPRWLKSVQLQTSPAYEIIIVLGEKHGLDEVPVGVKVIYYDQPATMGFLRNLAVDAATGDYLFYFSADDILLGNALREISKVDADIIALRFYQETRERVTPEILSEKLPHWQAHYLDTCGYMAFKKGLRYDDTGWPNYPLLFQAYTKGYTFKATKELGAVYIQRPDCHSQFAPNHAKGKKEIGKYVSAYNLTKG